MGTILKRFCIAAILATFTFTTRALDIVIDGKPHATIVIEDATPVKPNRARANRNQQPGDAMAAQVLVDWIKKITGAELPIAATAPETGIVIYVGQSAIKAGLKLDDIDSPTHEGLRIICDNKRILLAGQNPAATVKAACRLLEELGCRYLMESSMGEVYPHTATLAVKEMDLSEKPGFALRQIWGSVWTANTLWKIWNGAGGAQYSQGHAWGAYVDKKLFESHPEYFALRNGQRKQGDWYCTSNPELRKIFAQGVMRTLAQNGGVSASISPPDGTGYCECDQCRAQDDPKSIEPSSGHVSITDRYANFFNDVARQVKEKYPDAHLSFYCYADYTQAPTRGLKLEPNLVAWIAPLRYCRLHGIDNPICPSRVQLGELIADWSKATQNIAYRTYNYNLAECLVPFPMLSIWKHDIPYLKQHGAIGINLETLASWQIYGPHMYLSLRLAYDPAANADALLDDYFQKFYGPTAAPLMKQYWLDIDKAFANLNGHAGSFFAIHRIYTPEFLTHCRQLLDQATAATKDDATFAARVAMHVEGFKNAEEYAQLRKAINTGQIALVQSIYKELLSRTTAQTAAGYGNHYTPDYVKRFLGKDVDAALAAIANGRIVAVLPDQMHMTYDETDKGRAAGYASETFDDSNWKLVSTFSETLDGQSLPDRKTIMWYRTTIEVPETKGKLSLFAMEIDGSTTLFINGKETIPAAKKRIPFDADGTHLHPGKNTIAFRVDHSAISELFLGGVIRPIYLIEKGVDQ